MARVVSQQVITFAKFVRRYFRDYGGRPAVFGSPLGIAAFLIGCVSYRTWMHPDWTSITLSVIPNLLGFSLGTYALLFSLISPRVRLALRSIKNKNEVSYFDEMNATFLHFIFVQVSALLWALLYQQSLFYDLQSAIAKIYPCKINLFPWVAGIGGFLGFLLLSYSILLVLGSSLTVYRIARIKDPADGGTAPLN